MNFPIHQSTGPAKMTETVSAIAHPLSPVKRALLALEDMKGKLDAAQYAKTEPIAIVGMGCRFPGGVDSPDSFWDLLRQGEDAVTDVPADRWNMDDYYDPNPDQPGKIYTRKGGFLTQPVDEFDPQFFGISAREAISLDPQQRLLLEVAWEALEQAHYSQDRLTNSKTGVFVGICSNDYNRMQCEAGNLEQVDAFSATGSALSIAAGRLSYALGLKGPSMAVDTACSSALVAIHLACQQLRQGDCEMAIAGGVNLLLAPESSVAFARIRVLDPAGACKTFDASASGYVRGEGCGIIVLKRLSSALADGDKILSVIRGSAVNHNGRSSSLVAPHGPSQQALIRTALAQAGVAPAQVSYVEVQGTSTALGQPIEVEALSAVLGENREPDQPLWIGSVKTNLGHLEAASGMASLIKVILSMQHGQIPAHLHFQTPNPYINWSELPVQVPTQLTPWQPAASRIAGVSAFGFSGTNAHLVLEEPPIDASIYIEPVDRPSHIFTLSAKTEAALATLVERYEKHLAANPDTALADLCFSANAGRTQFAHRHSWITSSTLELGEQLAAYQPPTPVEAAPKKLTAPKIAYLFSGEMAQNEIAVQQLYETQPVFRETFDRCQELLHPDHLPVMEASDSAVMLFVIEYALSELWASWGIKPNAVVGMGVGEYVAACVAGVFSLADALKLVAKQQTAAEVTYHQPKLALVCPRTGAIADTDIATSNYWEAIASAQIQLTKNIDTLQQQGCQVLLEIGLQSTWANLAGAQVTATGTWLVSLTPAQPAWQSMLQSLSSLYQQGVKVDWFGFDRGYERQWVDLPSYPWQRQRYWFETAAATATTPVAVSAPPETLVPSAPSAADLLHQLTNSGQFTPAEQALLPKLLERLSGCAVVPPAPTSQPATAASTAVEVIFEEIEVVFEEMDQDWAAAEVIFEEMGEDLVPPTLVAHLTASDIQDWLRQKIAQELGVSPTSLDVNAPFDSYGIDSMLALGIASAGQQFLGIEVSPILLMHYPTIKLLAEQLATEVATTSEVFEI
jgi:acyl transferase domain-containing protein